MTRPPGDWDAAYLASTPPPWDIGRPQPAFVQLAQGGRLSGRLLDAGCGTGEHTLLAAAKGADALGVDVSPPAIEYARRKATERQLAARFEVADALALDQLGTTFDTVIDCGLFHVFDDQERARYVASLASVVAPGGCLHLMCFSEREPGDWGPRRVRQDEITAAFSNGWTVEELVQDRFEINPGVGDPTAHAWRASIRRL
jgi:cyclopropane fatty-acyl-phospholipid synthase-like methyltransferase